MEGEAITHTEELEVKLRIATAALTRLANNDDFIKSKERSTYHRWVNAESAARTECAKKALDKVIE